MVQQSGLKHAIETNNLADVFERVLDKGMVTAGDIKIKLVDIEPLTIQLRLIICSVGKAKDIGMDWWTQNSAFRELVNSASVTTGLEQRIDRLKARLAARFDLES